MSHLASSGESPAPSGRRGALARAIVLWAVIAALLVAALGAAWGALSRDVYGPAAFVREYLDALSVGDAAGALTIPGVAVDRADLNAAGLPAGSSDALLRKDALGVLSGIRFISDVHEADGSHSITFAYTSGGLAGKTTYRVSDTGSTFGLFPSWTFQHTPLSSIALTVQHSTQFRANGFALDTRQVAPAEQEAGFTNTVSLLTFTPSAVDFDLDTPLLHAAKQTVHAVDTRSVLDAAVKTKPTAAFVDEVRTQLTSYLDSCATQVVLQPTGCPFGMYVKDRVTDAPVWSITTVPDVQVLAGGTSWVMPSTPGAAHIVVEVQSLFDGSVSTLDEDVPFSLSAFITVRDDASLFIDLR
ncbi:hypothetical protein ACL9RL_17480 [Plantibacter sp. Mn2098]|uniref:hypothetical protein n=1 Tax=Plantibacter sp. Mn2098 TaxID=3395266 RepID=UPI003BD4F531